MDIENIRKQLPHGALTEIAMRTNYSKGTISLFFKGKATPTKSADILKATADILREYKIKEKEAIGQINEVLGL